MMLDLATDNLVPVLNLATVNLVPDNDAGFSNC